MSDTNKREYKIYPTDLGYSIFRQKDNDSISVVQYLNWYGKRSPNKRTAKAFMNKNDAVSGLIIARRHGDKLPEEDYEKQYNVKTVWSSC